MSWMPCRVAEATRHGPGSARPPRLHAVGAGVAPEQLVVVLVELRVRRRPPPHALVLRGHDLAEARDAAGLAREHGEVANGRVVPLVDEPARRAVLRVPQAERPSLLVHELQESLPRAARGLGQRDRGVVRGGEQQAVVELPDGHALAGLQAFPVRDAGRLARHPHDVGRPEVLHGHERGHDLRRRRDRPAHVLPLRPEDPPGACIDDDRRRRLDFRALDLRGAAGGSTRYESRKTAARSQRQGTANECSVGP